MRHKLFILPFFVLGLVVALSSPALAVPFMNMIQINHSDQPILGTNNPFDFLFTNLPAPTGDVDLTISGVADVNSGSSGSGEDISVLADTLDLGTHGPFGSFVFSFPLSITGGNTNLLNDGQLLVRLTLGDEVHTGDFLKVTLAYDAASQNGAIPEPSTVVLFGTGLVGPIGYAWRRKRHEAAKA